jgi:hypothetical protein
MSSYVNLIQPSEIKYHSVATDKRFLIKAGVGLALLFGLYVAWTRRGVPWAPRAPRARPRAEWEEVKPKHAAAIHQTQALVKLRGTRGVSGKLGRDPRARPPTSCWN